MTATNIVVNNIHFSELSLVNLLAAIGLQLSEFLISLLFQIIGGIFVQMVFLGQAFTVMLVYVWSRRNPHIQVILVFLILIFTKII